MTKEISKPELNIVWLKRDLRTQDHLPLYAAEKDPLDYLIVYLFELEMIDYPDTSLRHLQFTYHSILSMNLVLEKYNRKVEVFYGNASFVFDFLISEFQIRKVFSYQEHGIQKTWNRDKNIQNILGQHKIEWREFQKNGVFRGIKNREGWDKKWYVKMHSPMIENVFTKTENASFKHPFCLPKDFESRLSNYSNDYQPAGERYAWKYLASFVRERGFNYNKHISNPLESRKSCSRLSPFIAWGNLSIRQVYQFVKGHDAYQKYKRPFASFLMRLKWHCHFIQKFETECTYETLCINKGFELLKHEKNIAFISAWKNGQTGYPLLDACMRCLNKTGWMNFRMRAMMVSFLCYQLDQDWRSGVYHLAKQFLDYEPGIHYPQFQMQAGTTGINTIRMYNPVKQSYDRDAKGIFIKKWIPELRNVPVAHIHEPWKMTLMDQLFYGIKIGIDYPLPIVDLEKSSKKARAKIWGHRNNEIVRKEKKQIVIKHTRNSFLGKKK